MKGTLTLNASMEVLAFVPWQRAVCLVLTNDATVWQEHETERVRSQRLDMARPTVIVLNRYVHVSFSDKERAESRAVSFREILKRDQYTCAYCGKAEGLTVDHIQPKSRGGQDTWYNLVACCKACNGFKADRTPQEAGMRLLWEPYAVQRNAQLQRQVWKGLNATEFAFA